jgi:2-iminoacetate synthase
MTLLEQLDTAKIEGVLSRTKEPSSEIINNIIAKARLKKGLTPEDVGYLVNIKDPEQLKALFQTARAIKWEIYGERLVFFAPLYISDYCVNDCAYCNFHSRNTAFPRQKLTLDEIGKQVEFLINEGHKRVLLELGEDDLNTGIDYVVEAIEKIYLVHTAKGEIRRVNVNIAATTVENYRKLKTANIGTYQLFQETYHRATYERLHKGGPKADYERQVTAHTRAFEAGLDDFGLGVLFGLYDWRYEVVSLVIHAQGLEEVCGVGPHTISVPRFCAADSVSYKTEYPVSDEDFLKLIAILRLAVPYTGMIISTRETPAIRKIAFQVGISQSSAGSVTTTGGYGKSTKQPQFDIHDSRSLKEVIGDVLKDKLIPSFCTACYRLGRTGERFMELAKPGEIHNFCRPNAILTFAEYLKDYAADGLTEQGNLVIKEYLAQIDDPKLKAETEKRLVLISQGKRDLFF